MRSSSSGSELLAPPNSCQEGRIATTTKRRLAHISPSTHLVVATAVHRAPHAPSSTALLQDVQVAMWSREEDQACTDMVRSSSMHSVLADEPALVASASSFELVVASSVNGGVPRLLYKIQIQNLGTTKQRRMVGNERRSTLGESHQKIDE